MPRRNVLAILGVVVLSVFCFRQVDHNPYGRYLSHVLSAIENQALVEVPEQVLFDGAMEGIIKQLHDRGDSYSSYISAADRLEFKASLEQEFGGVGVMIRMEEDDRGRSHLTVVNPPLYGTPAHSAGIEAGDRIVAIDGQATRDMTMKEVIALMRGAVGEKITLSILHDDPERQPGDPGEPRQIEVERAIIRVPSVLGDRTTREGKWDFRLETDRRIGYIRINNFGEKTASELAEALDELDSRGVEGLIIDLRDNPGGLLDAAVEVCDMFIPANRRIVTIKGRDPQLNQEFDSTGEGRHLDLPMVVLVNHYSASASEIVAACLQDYDRAVIIGQRTWGKGTVQHVIDIEAGKSILKLTSASYHRPSGTNIHRLNDAPEDEPWGVLPNEGFDLPLDDHESNIVRRDRRDRDIFQAEPPALDPARPPEPPVDPQLDRAIEYLRSKMTPQEGELRAA
jgi:carboxyl-terminal processing protease